MYFDELRTVWYENKNAKKMGTEDKNEVPPLPLPLRVLPRREGSPRPGFGALRVSGTSEKVPGSIPAENTSPQIHMDLSI